MPVAPIPQERLAVLQKHMDEMAAAQGVVAPRVPAQMVANVQFAKSLSMWTRLVFRGRPFDVPPVPWADGVRLLELQYHVAVCGASMEEDTVKELTEAQMREVLERLGKAYEELAGIFYRLVRPVRITDRLLWRALSNPFWNATAQEMSELLDFFFECLMKSGVRHGGLVPARE